MASQILENVLATELKCDKMLNEAKHTALELGKTAAERCDGILNNAKAKAKQIKQQNESAAQKKADEILERGRLDAEKKRRLCVRKPRKKPMPPPTPWRVCCLKFHKGGKRVGKIKNCDA